MSYAKMGGEQSLVSDRRTEKQLLEDITRTLHETDEVSTETLGTLHGQTEQLQTIQAHSDAIDNNLNQSETLLRSLKPWGWMRNMFRKEKSGRQRGPIAETASVAGYPPPQSSDQRGAPAAPGYPAQASQASQAGQNRTALRLEQSEQARRAQAGGAPGGSSSSRPGAEANAELDKAYDQIEALVDGLSHKSQLIKQTLDKHNEMLPDIVSGVDGNNGRVNKQKQDLQKLMRSSR